MPEILSPSGSPPPVIVPLAEGADAKAIGALLCGGGPVKGPIHWPTCATIKGVVFAGSNDALERVRQINPAARPRSRRPGPPWETPVPEVLLIPSPDTRRVVEEMLPNCPGN